MTKGIHMIIAKLILIPLLLQSNGLSDNSIFKHIYNEINLIDGSLESYTKIENNDINVYKDINPDNYSFESTTIYRLGLVNLIRFYDATDIKKAMVFMDGDRQTLTSKYYYINNSVFYVVKSMTCYEQPKWADNFKEEEKVIYEMRCYFDKGTLIKCTDSRGKEIRISEISEDYEQLIIMDSELYNRIAK
jgi:hypothetical protein